MKMWIRLVFAALLACCALGSLASTVTLQFDAFGDDITRQIWWSKGFPTTIPPDAGQSVGTQVSEPIPAWVATTKVAYLCVADPSTGNMTVRFAGALPGNMLLTQQDLRHVMHLRVQLTNGEQPVDGGTVLLKFGTEKVSQPVIGGFADFYCVETGPLTVSYDGPSGKFTKGFELTQVRNEKEPVLIFNLGEEPNWILWISGGIVAFVLVGLGVLYARGQAGPGRRKRPYR